MFTAGNFERSKQDLQAILDLSIQADTIKQYLVSHITKSLIMPISRKELLLLIRGQDRIAAHAYNVAFQLDVRHTIVTEPIRKHMDEHINSVARCVETLLDADEEVQKVLTSAFGRKAVEHVIYLTTKGLECERHADHLKEEAIKSIFQDSEKLGTLGVYHLLKLVELVDRIAHHAKHTGIRLASIVAK